MLLTFYLLVLVFIWTGMAAKSVVPPCNRNMFDSNVANCLSDFNKSMETTGFQDTCPWPTVKRTYFKLQLCLNNYAADSWCKGHKFLLDEIFLEVHKTYFSLCGRVHDPPLATLIMLIAPVTIATLLMPLMCLYVTTWNTEMPSIVGL